MRGKKNGREEGKREEKGLREFMCTGGKIEERF